MPVEISREIYEDCGTYAAVIRHGKDKTPICDPCKEARREYMRAWRLKNPQHRPNRRHVQVNIPVDILDDEQAVLELVRRHIASVSRETGNRKNIEEKQCRS